MFVGEQPGDQEDLRGQPFVGPAGQLFDRALATGMDRATQVYVTNAVKHSSTSCAASAASTRPPAQQEAAACLHWLESEIALVRPERDRRARRHRGAPAAGPAGRGDARSAGNGSGAATACGCW